MDLHVLSAAPSLSSSQNFVRSMMPHQQCFWTALGGNRVCAATGEVSWKFFAVYDWSIGAANVLVIQDQQAVFLLLSAC